MRLSASDRGASGFRFVLLASVLSLIAIGCFTRSGFQGGDGGPEQNDAALAPGDFGARLSAAGSIVLTKNLYALAIDGENYGVVWLEHAAGEYGRRFVFSLISPDGATRAGPHVIEEVEGSAADVQLFATGTRRFLFVYKSDGLRIGTIDASGAQISSSQRNETSYDYTDQDIFPDGQGFAVAFRRYVNELHRAHLQRFDETGRAREDAIALEEATNHQYTPRGAFTGSDYFIVWQDYASPRRIRYAVVSGLDLSITGTGAVSSSGSSQYYPKVVSNGEGHQLVFWQESDTLWELALAADGAPLWEEKVSLIPYNRIESFDYFTAGGDGRIGIVWESDRFSVFTQIRFATLDSLDGSAPDSLESEHVGDDDYGLCCPVVGRGSDAFAVLFRGVVEGEFGLFFREIGDR